MAFVFKNSQDFELFLTRQQKQGSGVLASSRSPRTPAISEGPEPRGTVAVPRPPQPADENSDVQLKKHFQQPQFGILPLLL